MKKHLFSLSILLSLVFSVSAQKAKQTETEKNLRTHISYLASDALEGRKTGERGGTSAAGYIANMFARYKLDASLSDKKKKNYMLPFEYVSGVETGANNSLAVNGRTFALKTEWMPVGYTPDANIPATDVVFAGFGIASERLKYDDYEGLDVRNKIVLVLAGNPDNGNPHSQFGLIGLHAKANIAKQKGAKALFVIARDEDFSKEDLAQLNYNQTLGELAVPTVVVSRPSAARILQTDETGLQEVEKWMAMRKETPASIRIKFAGDFKASAEASVDLDKKQAEAYNVIGIIEGRDERLKNEAIVIGAHYDHLGRGGEGSLAPNSNEIHNGADDNASGTSALLELARQFRKDKNNKRTLIFIAFGGEESGLLGSKAYTENPVFPLDKTVAMINMDMVGRLNDRKLTVGGIGTSDIWKELVENMNLEMSPTKSLNISKTSGSKDIKLKNKIEQTLEREGNNGVNVEVSGERVLITGIFGKGKMETGIKDISDVARGYVIVNTAYQSETETPSKSEIERSQNPKTIDTKDLLFSLQLNQDGFGPSDHSSFYAKQIPVLFFFTGTHADYHKPSDDADKINYEGLEQITGYVAEIVKAVDQNPARPVYKVAESSNTMTRRGFNVSLGTVPSYADNDNTGLVLDGVRDDSPAAKAGIKAGDKIVGIGGKEVRNISDYMFMLGEMKAGETYEIVVMRGAEKLTLKIVPDPR